MEFSDLPGWKFTVEEISFGVFTVSGRHVSGAINRKTGTDPDALLERCRIELLEALATARKKPTA
jgi:hypothetical protein